MYPGRIRIDEFHFFAYLLKLFYTSPSNKNHNHRVGVTERNGIEARRCRIVHCQRVYLFVAGARV